MTVKRISRNTLLSPSVIRPIRVIKVGGSLFDLPNLGKRITSWLDCQPPAFNLLIAGGGKLVDAVRSQSLDELSAHWQCIHLMTKTANFLAEVLPDLEMRNSLPESACHSTVIFSPASWLREVELHLPGTRLRESWDVTSDSIAARVAICLNAAELVLLKSVDPPSQDFTTLAECGYLDRMFPEISQAAPPVRMVNLRQFPCDSLNRA